MELLHYFSEADEWSIIALNVSLLVAAALVVLLEFRPAKLLLGASFASAYWLFTDTHCFSFHPPEWPEGSAPFIAEHAGPLGVGQLQREFVDKGIPAVLRGLGASEVRDGAWTPDWLATTYGRSLVTVHAGAVEHDSTDLFRLELAEFLEVAESEAASRAMARGGRMPYLAEDDALMRFPGMRRGAARLHDLIGVSRPWWNPQLSYQTLMWIGPRGTRTGLHWDMDPLNVLFQMNGTKTLWLIPPEDRAGIAESRKYDYGATLGTLDPFASGDPDHGVPGATVLRVDLSPGDALFVPPRWFHYAESTSPSISVSLRTFSTCEAMSLMPLMAAGRLHAAGLYRNHDGCTCHGPRGYRPE